MQAPHQLPIQAAGDRVAERVRAERVRMLYGQARPAVLISILVSAIVCGMLWYVSEQRRLVTWFTLVALVGMIRTALVAAYWRSASRESAVAAWERRFIVTIALTSATWGIGGWWILPEPLAHQAAVYMFLMGMAGGAAVSYSAHAVCVIVTITLVMLPATASFLMQGEPLLRTMALGGMIYIGAAYRASKMLAASLQRTYELSQELHEAHQEAQALARTDELTGMKNRRAFYEMGQQALQIAKRHGHPFAAIVLDVDHFKRINDTWGHAAGDAAIRAVARVIQETVRASDISGRIGGEEFGILLPETGAAQATGLAERLRTKIAAIAIEHYGATVKFTASFGVAEISPVGNKLEPLLAMADEGLYEAKSSGRDRVVCQGRTAA